jgi:hypothetical protein
VFAEVLRLVLDKEAGVSKRTHLEVLRV